MEVQPTIAMPLLLIILLLVTTIENHVAMASFGFVYNGFRSANLSLNGLAEFTFNGLLELTNMTDVQQGSAFYPNPITFKNSENSTNSLSFSTTFVCAIVPQYPTLGSEGMTFVIAPTKGFPGALSNQFLGLFNQTNNGNVSNHVFAVELDTFQSREFDDINDNHVGIDINGLKSKAASPASYYDNKRGSFRNVTLIRGRPMQVWVEYYSKTINVTLAPLGEPKPIVPLLSLSYDLSPIMRRRMYVGFSAATAVKTSHYVLGWSFKVNGKAEDINRSRLPRLPRVGPKRASRFLTIGVPLISIITTLTMLVLGIVYCVRRRQFAELLEDWEEEYGPHRFKFKDLYIATKGFSEDKILGSGGFGRVYKGTLRNTKTEVAVKRVSHESRQGAREFVAEIVSIGRLRHRNLVSLLGYSRRERELLLVYEYMPNGSLDKFLYNQGRVFSLDWNQRLRIIKGVASGLLYLHEEWEQVVIHRDIKASNVLLDCEFNARLGDFGLARLYDHGTDPQTTKVVGTMGYLAPEHTRTGKSTTKTDVYSFGSFLLEVVCGRRPIEPQESDEKRLLVPWVFNCWTKGEILHPTDPNMGREYGKEEAEMILKLGLLCSHSDPKARPTMRQVCMYLDGTLALPELEKLCVSSAGLIYAGHGCFDVTSTSYPSSIGNTSSYCSITTSLVFGGR